ncbi:unnamed protein product [Ectocarpus fasciculatus]
MYRYLLCGLVIFAPPSKDDVPCLAFRLRGRAAADSTPPTNQCRGAGPTSRGCLTCCAGAELTEDPVPDTLYCPVENRFKQRQAPGLDRSNGATCESVSVQVKNSSGAKIAIFWLGADDQEEFQQYIGLEETRVILACRGHVWRARHTSSGTSGRRRLLSEMMVPPSVEQTPSTLGLAASSSNQEEVARNVYRWEVLACAGFPLPKVFDLMSSLGGLGLFRLSRGTLGRSLTVLQEATLKQSTDIEGLVSITLEEALVGKDVAVNVRRRVPCPECHGYGAASFVPCDRCGGSGRRVHHTSLSSDGTPPRSIPVTEHGASGCCGNGSSSGSGEGCPHTNSTGSACASHECGRRDGLGGDVHRGSDCPAGHTSCKRTSDPPCRCPEGEDICVEGAATDDDNNERGATERLRLTRTADCAGCGGSGMVPTPSADGGSHCCPRCTGARFVEETVDLVLSIPAGVEKGHTEVYRGEGHVDLGDLLGTLRPRASSGEATMGDADTGEASGPSSAPPPCSSPPSPGASPINSQWDSPTCSPSSSSSSPCPPTTSPGSSESTRGVFYASPRKTKLKTGNFRLTVDVLPHAVFSPAEEGGADLYATVTISVAEALKGFTREIAGLDGSIVTVRRTSRTLPGMTLRFPGLGMPLYSPPENKRYDERAGNPRRSGRGETMPEWASGVVEAGSEGLSDGRAARDSKMVAHGDLVVEALVKLPAGMRTDRSNFIGSFLKDGSKTARVEANTGDDDD